MVCDMSIDYEELQKYFDEHHGAVNDPLNPGLSEEDEDADPDVIDATDEKLGFVITPSKG